MGSLEEERLIQMVIDYIEFEPDSSFSLSPSDHSDILQKPLFPTLEDVLCMVTDAETKILEKIMVYTNTTEESSNLKNMVLWGLKMDGFEVSLCRTSWVATFGRPSVFEFTGDYEYIDIMMNNKNNKEDGHAELTRLIVDMDFRSHFEIARPTDKYSELLNYVPCIFVGTEEKLMKVISIICSAAKLSLREKGLHIPPWRKASYMQSKWLSKNCCKISSSSMDFPNEQCS